MTPEGARTLRTGERDRRFVVVEPARPATSLLIVLHGSDSDAEGFRAPSGRTFDRGGRRRDGCWPAPTTRVLFEGGITSAPGSGARGEVLCSRASAALFAARNGITATPPSSSSPGAVRRRR